MDYVVGSVAALISGNVTPNRPKLMRRAITPTKHQPSPNVTPKSEFVDDRTIFLSPTQQKKKAVVKKSPKRIFQNPDLDNTEDLETDSNLTSPKAEKVKKHLIEQLDVDDIGKKKISSQKSLCNNVGKLSVEILPDKNVEIENDVHFNDRSPKKKQKRSSISNINKSVCTDDIEQVQTANITEHNDNSPKKKIQRQKSAAKITDGQGDVVPEVIKSNESPTKEIKSKADEKNVNNITETQKAVNNQIEKKKKKRKKKNKKPNQSDESTVDSVNTPNKETNNQNSSQEKQNKTVKKNKKRKNKSKQTKEIPETANTKSQEPEKMNVDEQDEQSESESEEVKSKNIPNPNAITEKDSDSEHGSDDDIESENEQTNEKILANETAEQEESSDEEELQEKNNKKVKKNEQKGEEVISEEEIKRTLFVGNVPFSNKCKKEIKKIFGKYGQIETIRIRTIPVKDARVTPKLAIIKNELHPERTSVNVYVKYADAKSLSKALSENNTILNGYHLRVSRSDTTGAEHDPRCAVFVGNLPFGIEDETLRSKFESCGEIVSVRVIRDKKTNAGKGFGYVNFASKDGVELALGMSEDDLMIKNRNLRVKRCTQAQSMGKKPGGSKFGGGNKFGGGGKFGGESKFGGGAKFGGGSKFGGGGKFGGENKFGGGGKFGGESKFGGGGKFSGGSKFASGGKFSGGGNSGSGRNFDSKFNNEGKWGNQAGQVEGAARRVMHKRKQQDNVGDGPPNKMQKHTNQPNREKKPRKEFVGMTSEKKKKHKFNKGQKKKKALSEILTKNT